MCLGKKGLTGVPKIGVSKKWCETAEQHVELEWVQKRDQSHC